MDQEHLTKYGLIGVFLILLYFSYLTIAPYITYLMFSVVLVILLYPIYKRIAQKTNSPKIMSLLFVLAVILLIVVPTVFVGVQVIQQAPAAYANIVGNIDAELIEEEALDRFGVEIEVQQALQESVNTFSDYVFNNIGGVLTEAMNILLGLFVMFFVMYYLFIDAENILERIQTVIPLPKKHQKKLFGDINHAVHGIVNGMVIVGVIQGVLGGIVYVSLSVPNSLFWALATTVVSIIPLIGSFIIWMPIAAWLFVTGEVVRSIILLVLGSTIISQSDNLIRPIVVSKTATIHPALVMIGVLGGLSAFGVIGFIIGPLILALLVTVTSFYKKVAIEPESH